MSDNERFFLEITEIMIRQGKNKKQIYEEYCRIKNAIKELVKVDNEMPKAYYQTLANFSYITFPDLTIEDRKNYLYGTKFSQDISLEEIHEGTYLERTFQEEANYRLKRFATSKVPAPFKNDGMSSLGIVTDVKYSYLNKEEKELNNFTKKLF